MSEPAAKRVKKSRPSSYSVEECVAAMQAAAERNGGRLSMEAYTRLRGDGPSVATIGRKLGGWPAACTRAGVLQERTSRPRTWTRESCVEAVAAYAADTSGLVTKEGYTQWRDQARPSTATIEGLLGGWRAACVTAGVPEDRMARIGTVHSDEECLAALRAADQHVADGGPLSATAYDRVRGDGPSSMTIISRFGGWVEARRLAGIERAVVSHRNTRWSPAECVAAINEAHSKVSGRFTADAYDVVRGDGPSSKSIQYVFGSWAAACQRAAEAQDVAPAPALERAELTASEAWIVTTIRAVDALTSGPVTEAVYTRLHGSGPSLGAVLELFGTWPAACAAAGVAHGVSVRRHVWSLSQCVEALREVAGRMEGAVSATAYDAARTEQQPTSATIINKCGSWKVACERAGVDVQAGRMRAVGVSEQTHIAALRAAAERNGGSLTTRDYTRDRVEHAPQAPSASTIRNWFGSWKVACERAGIEQRAMSQWTPEQCIAALQHAAGQVDGPLGQWRYDVHRGEGPSTTTIAKVFGSWNAACDAAGVLAPTRRSGGGVRFSDEECIEAVRRAAAQVAGRLTQKEYRKHRGGDDPTTQVLMHRFETWSEVCRRAGVAHTDGHRGADGWTRQECLDAMRAASVEGHLPANVYVQHRRGGPSVGAITTLFGSWDAACQAAGVSPVSARRRISGDACRAALREVAARVDGSLTQAAYTQARRPGQPSVATITKMLGSWSAACEQAGVVQATAADGTSRARQECIVALQRAAAAAGAPLTQALYNEHRGDGPSPYVIRSLFGSWPDACAAAGVVNPGRGHRPSTITADTCIVALRHAAAEVGGPLTQATYLAHRGNGPTLIVLRRVFGSWSAACAAAGVDRTRDQYVAFDEAGMVADVQRAAAAAGVPPGGVLTMDTYNAHRGNAPIAVTLSHQCGSWEEVCERAGFAASRGSYGEQDYLDAMRAAADRVAGPLTGDAYARDRAENNPHGPSAAAIRGFFGTWKGACEAAGVDAGKIRWDRDECIAALQRAATMVDGRLTSAAYLAHRGDGPTLIVFYRVFGSWSAAVAAAGLEGDRPAGQVTGWTREECVAALQQAAGEAGLIEFDAYLAAYRADRRHVPAPHVQVRQFGSWAKACSAAGVQGADVVRGDDDWLVEECVAAVREVAGRIEGPLPQGTYDLWRDGDMPRSLVVCHRFGSWLAACEAAGVVGHVSGPLPRWSGDECVDALVTVAARIVGPLTMGDYDRMRDPETMPTAAALCSRYGSWPAACETAGVHHRGLYRRDAQGARELYLEGLRQVAARVDGPLTMAAYARERGHLPSTAAVIDMFGSWAQACEAAGVRFGLGWRRPTAWTQEECLEALRAVSKSAGGALTIRFYNERRGRWPSAATVAKHCGSWSAACAKARVA